MSKLTATKNYVVVAWRRKTRHSRHFLSQNGQHSSIPSTPFKICTTGTCYWTCFHKWQHFVVKRFLLDLWITISNIVQRLPLHVQNEWIQPFYKTTVTAHSKQRFGMPLVPTSTE